MNTLSNPQRIDTYIRKHLQTAESPDFQSVKESARAASRHGFTNCANSRYVDFMEAFKSSPELSKVYSERYPNSIFLPWKAFHNIRKSLKLWCDLPENYAGAVPPEQIPWLDLFELEKGDTPQLRDTGGLLEITDSRRLEMLVAMLQLDWTSGYSSDDIETSGHIKAAVLFRERGFRREKSVMETMLAKFTRSFFVLAPPEAFTATEDFIERFNKAVESTSRSTVAPDDPLVIRFCKGGCLVVAAWGEEASELNKLAQETGV